LWQGLREGQVQEQVQERAQQRVKDKDAQNGKSVLPILRRGASP
jgi:hypothetical protein